MDRIKTPGLIALVAAVWLVSALLAARAQTLIVPMPDSWATPAPTVQAPPVIVAPPPPPPVVVVPPRGSSTVCTTFGTLTYCTN